MQRRWPDFLAFGHEEKATLYSQGLARISLYIGGNVKSFVVVNESEYGFDAHCPALKGRHAQGDMLDEADANIKDAIEQYLAVLM